MKFNKKTVFIVLFAVLYLCVGLVSTIHAVSFFGLANAPILGTILAVTFEIGQAAVLFNLLTSPAQRKKFMPWALMCILTLVQILGNIFSSYKYLITNSTGDLRYFKEPIFTWTDLPDEQCNVIITYIVGAILPIVALCLTEMVVSYLGEEDESETSKKTIDTTNNINNTSTNTNVVIDNSEQEITEEIKRVETPETITTSEITEDNQQLNETNTLENISDELEEDDEEMDDELEEDDEDDEEIADDIDGVDVTDITPDTKEAVSELLTGNIQQDGVKPMKQSHFINIK